MKAIAIPGPVLQAIYAHARRAFPAECCGYLVGVAGGTAVQSAVACTNVQEREQVIAGRDNETAFAIAGAELLAFARSFDSEHPAQVVYHSHTNGRAYFSDADRAMAVTPDGPTYPVQHLVIGVTAAGITDAVQLAWSAETRDYVEIARWQG